MNVRERYDWIVTLRAIAALAIVLLHVTSTWMVETEWGGQTGARWFLDGVIIQVLVRWAVPVFILISGFLLLNPDKDMPLVKIKHYVLRMVFVLVTFGYAYCLIESVVSRGMENIPMQLLLSVRNLLAGKSWAHMWYVYMLIGLYLITPMLRIFVLYADRRTMCFTLTVLFVLTILRPTIQQLIGLECAELIPVRTPYLFYYLMGYMIYRYPIKFKKAVILLVVGITGTMATLLIRNDIPLSIAQPDNAFVAMYAIGLFVLSMKNKKDKQNVWKRFVNTVSKYSFGIYLLHPFFLNLIYKGVHIFPDVLPVGVGEFAFFVYALVCAWLSTWLCCRFPCFAKVLT